MKEKYINNLVGIIILYMYINIIYLSQTDLIWELHYFFGFGKKISGRS